MITFNANIAGVACVVDFAALPAESQTFVVEYGIRQYLNDGAAVSKNFVSGDKKGQAKTDDEIAAEKREGVEERLANLASGEFTRRGPAQAKLSPEERARQEITLAKLGEWAKGQNKKLPTRTGKAANPELLDSLIKAFYAKNKEAIDKEVVRRMKAEEKIDLGDMTDIAALLG